MSSDLSIRIRELIAGFFEISITDVQPEHTFLENLGADSLDMVELVMHLEDGLGIEIPDVAAEKIKTVQDAINFAQDRIKA